MRPDNVDLTWKLKIVDLIILDISTASKHGQ
jgi:hypothetical protein